METIAELYEKQLEIPMEKSKKQFLLCPVGLVGAGKTTVVKLLAKELGLLRISNDEIREMFVEKDILYTGEDVYAISYPLIKKYVSDGYSMAFDANCSTQKDAIESFSKQFNIPAVWIHIETPEALILERLRTFKRGNIFKDADDAIEHYFRSKKERVELDKNIPYVYTFDTSKDDLSVQITEAITKITDLINS